MLGRVVCETCDGYCVVEAQTFDGDWVEIDCKDCHGEGGFDLHGPLTREEAERRATNQAAWQAFSDSLVKHECTHCDRQGFEAQPQPPRPCGDCPDGIVVPLRELQAAAHPVLPWRREGDRVTVAAPTPLRDLHIMLDRAGIAKGSLGQRIAAALQDRQAWMDAAGKEPDHG